MFVLKCEANDLSHDFPVVAMPRILLNTTTLNKGGALQTSTNFLAKVLQDPAEFSWQFALSESVAKEAEKANLVLPSDTEIFQHSPARNNDSRRRLKELADRWQPDAVFTFSGPAYVKFSQPHLMGCSEGWVTHASWEAYRTLKFPIEWLKFWSTIQYKKKWFRHADLWITQTENARQGLHRRLGMSLDKIHVVSNSCGKRYFEQADAKRPFPSSQQKVRIFCFAAGYKHKNLRILPAVAAELKKLEPQRAFEIVLTLPANSEEWNAIHAAAQRLGGEQNVVNHGPVPVMEGPEVFSSCDILLLPTVLETFTATYPEAMAMGLPIVTTDLDFAHDICAGAALYFSPRDPLAAARCIQQLLHDEQLWHRLIASGKQQLQRFPQPSERAAMYLDVIRKLLANR